MPDFFLIVCFGTLGLAVFVLGVLIGLITKNSYRYRVLLNQNRGEAIVRKLITSNFKSPSFHLLNNITIPFQDGTTQIDHILISTKGVFVIEVKHYSGWIFANEKSKQWMQSIYRVKNQFQNPIHQNFRHVKPYSNYLIFFLKNKFTLL